jgi:Domain of unknown function (DUF4878)
MSLRIGFAAPTARAIVPIFLAVLSLLVVCACSDRPSVAARATVENFYGAMQNDNPDLLHDNIAASATQRFREHVDATAGVAQSNSDVRRSVQVVTIDPPSIVGDNARVRVVFADEQSDTVVLVREGPRWKVVSTGRLE